MKVQIKAKERILAFCADKRQKQLRDHALTGKYRGYRSINITGDIRALYYEKEDGRIVIFAFLGTHGQLYG
ncbi:MAG: type II toxin-antitoxin system mRNA interferase toxin, RelE/StbE family [Candidatus Saccharimonadales bacterium]